MLSHQSEELRKKMRGKARGEAAAQKKAGIMGKGCCYTEDYIRC